MKLLLSLAILAIVGMFIKNNYFSFRAQNPDTYSNTGPAFVLKKHLSGNIKSEGLIFGPTGNMTNSFVANMFGEWNGNSGTLSEEFVYSNGRKQSRKWSLTIGEGNQFSATAEDIVGTATGVVSGSTIKMNYRIVLPKEAGGHTLDVTDWLYLTDNGVILNKSELRKFGIKVAELVATMRPEGSGQ